jgi:ketosteroid isomerase-like protein
VTAAALLGVAVLVGNGKSFASDADDVKATINEFHAAVSALDLAKMDAIWVHDDRVMDKEPLAKVPTLGWEATRKNFGGAFGATAEAKVTQGEGPHIQVQGDTAWAMGVAVGEGKLKTGQETGQVFGGSVFEADVFKKQDGHWLYVSHAAYVLPP